MNDDDIDLTPLAGVGLILDGEVLVLPAEAWEALRWCIQFAIGATPTMRSLTMDESILLASLPRVIQRFACREVVDAVLLETSTRSTAINYALDRVRRGIAEAVAHSIMIEETWL